MTDTWESTPFIEEVWESQATGITWATVFRDGGAGGGAVDSVNGQTGTVVLDAGDVGALPDDTVIPDITGLQATSEKNQPNGYAGLDGDGTIPDNRIPSSIARDTEIGTQITAHDGSGTAHPDIRALVRPPFRIATPIGQWVGPPTSATPTAVSSGNLILSAVGRGNVTPIFLTAGTYDRIAIYVAAAAANTARLGLYAADSATGLPTGAALLDAGTVSSAATGQVEVAISFVLAESGWYWASVFVDAYAGSWQVSGVVNGSSIPGLPTEQTANLHTTFALSCTNQAAGALPDASVFVNWRPYAARVLLRRSA